MVVTFWSLAPPRISASKLFGTPADFGSGAAPGGGGGGTDLPELEDIGGGTGILLVRMGDSGRMWLLLDMGRDLGRGGGESGGDGTDPLELGDMGGDAEILLVRMGDAGRMWLLLDMGRGLDGAGETVLLELNAAGE